MFTPNPSNDRAEKNLTFLNLIREHKSISRSEIAKLTDTTMVTVSNYVNGYLKKGLLVESGYDTSSGGRRPELVGLNKAWGAALGIEVGVGRLRAAAVTLSMDVLSEASIDYPEEKKPHDYAKALCERIVSDLKKEKTFIKKIGIGLSESMENAEETDSSMAKSVEENMGTQAIVAKEALSRAFAEKILNPETHSTEKILYLNNDRAEGILLEGLEYRDADTKGENYAYLKPWGRAFGIVNKARRIAAEGVGTKIVHASGGETDKISEEIVIKAAKSGDQTASELIEAAGLLAGVRAAYLVNIFGPTLIVIGGGIERAGKIFFEAFKKSAKQFITEKIVKNIKIIPSETGEGACPKGAAFLAMREIFLEA